MKPTSRPLMAMALAPNRRITDRYLVGPISRRFAVMSLALLVILGVIRAPVSLITLILPRQVQLKNVEGSFWHGRASAIGVGGMIIQERVEWRFRPRAILSAGLAWDITGGFGKNASQMSVALRLGGAELDEVSVFLPLEPLVALHPKLKGIQLGAELHATANRLSFRAPAKASVHVERLFSALAPQASALGNYRVDIEVAADGKGKWKLTSSPGLLAATGEGRVDVARSHIDGQLVLTPSAPIPGLSQVLTQLPRSGEGFLITL
jgi:general secretion pathway protein N